MISLVKVTTENFDRFAKGIMEIEMVSFPTPWTSRAFEEETRRPLSSLWVLLEDTIVLGYVCFWVVANEVHLMNIAVRPEMRCQGLGKRLLDKMTSTGATQGAERVYLEVRPSNDDARELYRKIGFRETGFRPKYYRDTGEDAILMTLPLRPHQLRMDNRDAPLNRQKIHDEKGEQPRS